MSLLKQCIKELKISQASLADGIGWSRTAVNLFLNKGRVPVDAERFKAGVRLFAEKNPEMLAWLDQQDLTIEDFFPGPVKSGDLRHALADVLGQALRTGPRLDMITKLAIVSDYLLGTLRNITDTAQIEAAGVGMLGGRV